MKKISRIVSTILFTIIALHSNNLFAPYRPGKNQTSQQPKTSPYSAKATKGTAIPAKGSGTATPVKTDAQKKQEIAVLDKKINQGRNELADAVKKQKKAQTPEEKKLANQEIVKRAKEVLGWITQERNLLGDILGYYDNEKTAAEAVREDAENRLAALQGLVNEYKANRNKLLVEGWRGKLLGSIQPGKEAEYARITKKIDKLEPQLLSELQTKTRSQKIISGNQKFSKTKAFAITALVTALGATAAYTLLGPLTLKDEYDEFKKNPREYLTSRANTFKNMVSGLLSSTATKEAVANAAGTGLNETWTKYLVGKFGEATTALANEAYGITKSILVGMTVTPFIAQKIEMLLKQLETLIEDENSTQEQIEGKSQEIIDLAKENGIKIQKK